MRVDRAGGELGRAGGRPTPGRMRGRAAARNVDRGPVLVTVGWVPHDVTGVVVVARIPIALVRADVDERVDSDDGDRGRDPEQTDPVVLVNGIEGDVAGADVDLHACVDLDVLGIDGQVRVGDEVVAGELDGVRPEATVDRHRGRARDREEMRLRKGVVDRARGIEVMDFDRARAARSDLDQVLVEEFRAAPDVRTVDRDD